VRSLERRLDRLVRKAATRVAGGEVELPVRIGPDELRDALGRPAPKEDPAERTVEPGVATGLAVTGAGGDVLFVETATMPGDGGLTLTGQLGDVMQESGQIALSFLRANADRLGIELPDDRRVHVHFPAGAVPKDGSPPAADPRQDFRQRLGLTRTYRAFEALGYHFLLLDSVRVSGDKYLYHGWVDFEQREWIKEELSRIPRESPIVVVLHIPLLTAHYGRSRGTTFQARPNRVVVNNTEVLALFADRNLVLVLQGHLHVSELLRWRGTTFITGGAICAKWWRGPFFGTEEGFNAITLHQDRVEWEYLDYGWTAHRPVDQ